MNGLRGTTFADASQGPSSEAALTDVESCWILLQEGSVHEFIPGTDSLLVKERLKPGLYRSTERWESDPSTTAEDE